MTPTEDLPPTQTEAQSGAEPELAANWYATRLHYTDDLTPADPSQQIRGKSGTALCATEANLVVVYDKAMLDWFTMKYGVRTKRIDGLPLCKKCEKKIAGRAAVSS